MRKVISRYILTSFLSNKSDGNSERNCHFHKLFHMELTEVKGIGAKTAKLFNRLGVFDVEDLTAFYPVRFVPYEKMISIEEIVPGETVAVCARIKSGPRTIRAGKLKISEAVIEDFSGKIRCVWFNSPYIASGLDRDNEYVFSGKAAEKKNGIVLEHPIIYNSDEYKEKSGKLRPLAPRSVPDEMTLQISAISGL